MTVQDDRTPEEIEKTACFVVATDSFLSNWRTFDNTEEIVARSMSW